MKNQMYALCRVGVRAMVGLALCVSVSGCTDDYTLDDEKPEWLGESVYVRLQQDGNFDNYLRLMDDLGMTEVLSRTGSRTVFAANDSAFNAFYAYNATLPELDPWHNATSYDNLSKSQKALLAKSTMLNNAITMETLSTQESTLERGKYLRRPTLVSVADTVTYTYSHQLPYSYNLTGDMDFWSEFRGEGYVPGMYDDAGKGVYLTDGDGTNNMMLCFTAEQMAKQNVTNEDVELVMGQKRDPMDVFVYDAKVAQRDITCQNGYIDMVEKVIRPLPNMAEVIRTNGQTKIFSHILERFSAPVYVQSYNETYKLAHPEFTDKIYSKWYFSDRGTSSLVGADEENPVQILDRGSGTNKVTYARLTRGIGVDDYVEVPLTYVLKFDPAWNACSLVAGERAENDMAAMFVPEDAVLLDRFQRGPLRTLVEEWTTRNEPNPKEDYPGLDPEIGRELLAGFDQATLDNLEPFYKAIDQIPLNILQGYVSNLMRESFNGSVQSKFISLKNDAQESLFGTTGCIVKDVKLACNGAVYITTSFHAPADFSSVAAPAFMNTDKRVMKFAIYDGDSKQGWKDYMRGLNYYAYLKAMTSRFTLFLPDDEAMKYVYNPMSFKANNPRLVKLSYNKKFDKPATATGNPIDYEVWNYDIENATQKGNNKLGNANLTMDDIAGILTDVLQSHTLVHESESDLISQSRRNASSVADRDIYYVTKSNDAIKLTYNADGSVNYVQGGFQIENEQAGHEQTPDRDELARGTVRCYVKSASEFDDGGNGDTYVLNAPIIPATKSVYGVLSEYDEFQPFLDLCLGVDEDIIRACDFFVTEKGENMKTEDITRLLESTYSIFYEKTSTLDQVTAFFNQYQYTVFVPNAEALARAHDAGVFYSWDDIKEEFYANAIENPDYDGRTNLQKYLIEDVELRATLKAKVTHLFNFIRMHFMDGSVFADNSAWNEGRNFATSCFYQISATQGNFMKVKVNRGGRGNMTVQGLCVNEDEESNSEILSGVQANVLNVVVKNEAGIDVPLRNMMAREITVVDQNNNETSIQNQSVTNMNNKRIGNSSSAVIHLIDQVLTYDQPINLNNPAEARRYLKYNKVVNKPKQN